MTRTQGSSPEINLNRRALVLGTVFCSVAGVAWARRPTEQLNFLGRDKLENFQRQCTPHARDRQRPPLRSMPKRSRSRGLSSSTNATGVRTPCLLTSCGAGITPSSLGSSSTTSNRASPVASSLVQDRIRHSNAAVMTASAWYRTPNRPRSTSGGSTRPLRHSGGAAFQSASVRRDRRCNMTPSPIAYTGKRMPATSCRP